MNTKKSALTLQTAAENRLDFASEARAQGYWRLLLRVYLRIFIKHIQSSGFDQLPKGPKIIVANHPNVTDAFVLPFLIPNPLYFLITDGAFRQPLVGRFLKTAGQIPVEFQKGQVALAEASRKLKHGGTVVIFPEGRISADVSKLRRAGAGAAKLALMSGAPLVPIGFYVNPQDVALLKWGKKSSQGTWQFRGTCYVRAGQPFHLNEGSTSKEYANLRHLTRRIVEEIGRQMDLAQEDARE